MLLPCEQLIWLHNQKQNIHRPVEAKYKSKRHKRCLSNSSFCTFLSLFSIFYQSVSHIPFDVRFSSDTLWPNTIQSQLVLRSNFCFSSRLFNGICFCSDTQCQCVCNVSSMSADLFVTQTDFTVDGTWNITFRHTSSSSSSINQTIMWTQLPAKERMNQTSKAMNSLVKHNIFLLLFSLSIGKGIESLAIQKREVLFFFVIDIDLFRSGICVSEIRELFPWCRQIEFTEFLCQFQWFQHHPLFLIIITDLKRCAKPQLICGQFNWSAMNVLLFSPQRSQSMGNRVSVDDPRNRNRLKCDANPDDWQRKHRTDPKFHVRTNWPPWTLHMLNWLASFR